MCLRTTLVASEGPHTLCVAATDVLVSLTFLLLYGQCAKKGTYRCYNEHNLRAAGTCKIEVDQVQTITLKDLACLGLRTDILWREITSDCTDLTNPAAQGVTRCPPPPVTKYFPFPTCHYKARRRHKAPQQRPPPKL